MAATPVASAIRHSIGSIRIMWRRSSARGPTTRGNAGDLSRALPSSSTTSYTEGDRARSRKRERNLAVFPRATCPAKSRGPRAPGAASNLAGTGLGGSGRHCRLSDRLHRRSTPVRASPARLPPARSGSERLRLPPQIRSHPTHLVRQSIAWHREVDGDVAVMPAVYDPALQQPAVIWVQFPEKGAKSVTSHGLHWGDLGHLTGFSVVHVIAGLRVTHGPLVFPVLLFPSDRFWPPTYRELRPRPREGLGNTRTGRLLGHRGAFRGGMGIPGNPARPGWGLSARGPRRSRGQSAVFCIIVTALREEREVWRLGGHKKLLPRAFLRSSCAWFSGRCAWRSSLEMLACPPRTTTPSPRSLKTCATLVSNACLSRLR